jgi:hypothetical protein
MFRFIAIPFKISMTFLIKLEKQSQPGIVARVYNSTNWETEEGRP